MTHGLKVTISRVRTMSEENEDRHQDVIKDQKNHFKKLYEDNEGTPKAVASETYEHKKVRYSKIAKIFPDNGKFSIYEIGYGLGHFYEYLQKNFDMTRVAYSGSEIVKEYHEYCTDNYDPSGGFELRNVLENPPPDKYDYVVMSGVFHQIGDAPEESWEEYTYDLLKSSYELSTKGISFNFLSQFVDYKKEGNYYVTISDMVDFMNEDLSRFFEVRHNYPLFEATVFVYRPEYIADEYPQDEFQRYL